MVTKTAAKKPAKKPAAKKPREWFAAVTQAKGKEPEVFNTYEGEKDAAIAAAEFVVKHPGGAGWVERIIVNDYTYPLITVALGVRNG